MKLWEVADKATILKIKLEKGLDCKEEFNKYMKEAANIDDELFSNLLKINRRMWDSENKISGLIKENCLWRIGKEYKKLRELTHKRTEVKNAIAKKYGEFGELKKY